MSLTSGDDCDIYCHDICMVLMMNGLTFCQEVGQRLVKMKLYYLTVLNITYCFTVDTSSLYEMYLHVCIFYIYIYIVCVTQRLFKDVDLTLNILYTH